MTYAVHERFVMGGEINVNGDGDWSEVWQCTINCGVASDITDYDAFLAALSVPVWDWFNTTAAKTSNNARLSWMKLNQIGADGNYVDPSHPHTVDVTPVPGLTTQTFPAFCSVAYSWTTDKKRGPGSTGRVYIPNALAVTGEIISPSAQALAVTSAKGLLDAVSTVISGNHLNPVIASNVDASLTPITGVRVGRVLDVQRRRKNKVPEIYVADVWP